MVVHVLMKGDDGRKCPARQYMGEKENMMRNYIEAIHGSKSCIINSIDDKSHVQKIRQSF